jgi:hypothetical protein
MVGSPGIRLATVGGQGGAPPEGHPPLQGTNHRTHLSDSLCQEYCKDARIGAPAYGLVRWIIVYLAPQVPFMTEKAMAEVFEAV